MKRKDNPITQPKTQPKSKLAKTNAKDEISTTIISEANNIAKYADPTLDITFRMLFSPDQHKPILINMLNALLDFKGLNAIMDVEINSSDLTVSNIDLDKPAKSGITSAVDLLCTTTNNKKIAVEMQGQKKNYFLAREQEYMAKLISGQVKVGEGKKYHEKVLDTYIVVIGKENLFSGNSKLQDQDLFEIDVKPIIVQTGEVYPNNKMNWKFYELPKFAASNIYKNINVLSEIKHQWLEFFYHCGQSTELPKRNNIIQEAYKIMEIATWSPDDQVMYWKQKANEQDAYDSRLEEIEQAREEGKKEGKEEGIKLGLINGEISQIKTALKLNININNLDKLEPELHYIKGDKLKEIVGYLENHSDNTNENIMNQFHLLEDTEISEVLGKVNESS